MCRGCFSQLILRDEFTSGGIASLLGKASGIPTRRAFMAYSVRSLRSVRRRRRFGLRSRRRRGRHSAGRDDSTAAGRAGRLRDRGQGRPNCRGRRRQRTRWPQDRLDQDRRSRGRTLLPGLIDPHCHTIAVSLISELLDDVGYAKYRTRQSLVAHLRQEAATTPKGEWIVGANFDNLLQGGDFTRAELDGISSDHPILIWYINLHDACVNSEAFNIAGLGEDVGELPGGGHFGRGPDGKLNGMVYEESAMLKFAVHFLGKITPEVAAKAITKYSRHRRLRRQHDAA